MRQLAWAWGPIALLFAVAPAGAQVQPKSPPPAVSPTAVAPTPPKRGSAAWKYKDCLRRYKDHEGCRYLAFRRKTH